MALPNIPVIDGNGDATTINYLNSGRQPASDSASVVLSSEDFAALSGARPVTQSGAWTFGLSGPLPTGSNTIGAVTVSGSVGVTGPVTDAQLRATPVPVSGTFWQATQPVSAVSLPLPAGAATAANQTTANASLGAVTDAPAETAVGSFGLIALMKGVLAHLLGGTTQVEFATPQEMTGQFSVDQMPVTSTTTRQYNPTNVVQAAGSASSAAVALPTLGATREVRINTTEPVWIRFGTSSVDAASAASGSSLYGAYSGEVEQVPPGATHFRVIRAGSTDGTVEIKAVA